MIISNIIRIGSDFTATNNRIYNHFESTKAVNSFEKQQKSMILFLVKQKIVITKVLYRKCKQV